MFSVGVCLMLEKVINLAEIDGTEQIEYLYTNFFYPDFVGGNTYLNGNIYIDPITFEKEDGYEKTFWHLTTREHFYQKKQGKRFINVKKRLPDYGRAERIDWVKKIIENAHDEYIRAFYHIETDGKKELRLYLWLYKQDFVVILQKLGKSSSFLVTSFYIDVPKKRRIYQERYDVYVSRSKEELQGCEWF